VRGAQNAPAPSSRSARAVPGGQTTSSSYLTGYDATSGLALGKGNVLAVGSRGGQEQAFGGESWQWLLLGPLSR